MKKITLALLALLALAACDPSYTGTSPFDDYSTFSGQGPVDLQPHFYVQPNGTIGLVNFPG